MCVRTYGTVDYIYSGMGDSLGICSSRVDHRILGGNFDYRAMQKGSLVTRRMQFSLRD